MPISKQQREDQRYRMYTQRNKDRFLKVMRNPKLQTKVEEAIDNYDKKS